MTYLNTMTYGWDSLTDLALGAFLTQENYT
jgi:hypothetical protein